MDNCTRLWSSWIFGVVGEDEWDRREERGMQGWKGFKCYFAGYVKIGLGRIKLIWLEILGTVMLLLRDKIELLSVPPFKVSIPDPLFIDLSHCPQNQSSS